METFKTSIQTQDLLTSTNLGVVDFRF